MDAAKILKTYPEPAYNPVLISEVTRMGGDYRCVAGLDVRRQRIIRPLLTPGSNWRIGGDRSVFEVGHLVHVRPTGVPGKVYPHATEDTPLEKAPKVLERFDEETTYQLLIGSCASSIRSGFGVTFVDDQYVVAGTKCPSLVGVRIPRKKVTFHTGYGGKLRLIVNDSDGVMYDLGVTSDRLLNLFDNAKNGKAPFGISEANDWLKKAPDEVLILRLGLARAFDGKEKAWNPLRCYLQLNGIVCPRDHFHVLPYGDED